jgi:hypothetical protein
MKTVLYLPLLFILFANTYSFSQDLTGRINTVADGVELGKVNLWTSTTSSRKVKCAVIKGQKVRITKEDGTYYYVVAIGRSGCEGYCMKGFVNLD